MKTKIVIPHSAPERRLHKSKALRKLCRNRQRRWEYDMAEAGFRSRRHGRHSDF